MKRLFRVFAHIYHSHSKEIVALELEQELNTSFMRFMEYVQSLLTCALTHAKMVTFCFLCRDIVQFCGKV